MKHCIIGSEGFISKRHRKAIENIGGELVLTCDNKDLNYIDPDFRITPDFTDWVEMIHSPKFKEVGMISVCTPNYLHSVMVRECLRLGKKVLCEKPLTIFDDLHLEDPNLGVVLQLRHNPLVKKLKEENYSGNIKIEVASYRPPEYFESWKGQTPKSGGIVYNMGIHYLDLLIHLLGNPVSIPYSKISDKKAEFTIEFQRGIGEASIELLTVEAPVVRKIALGGEFVDLEGATIPLTDSGEVLDLHTEVYKDFIQGKRIGLREAKRSLDLAKHLCS